MKYSASINILLKYILTCEDLPYDPTNSTLEQLPGEKHNSKKTHALNAHSSTVYNGQGLEATSITNRGTGKEVLPRIYNAILLSHKKEQNCAICKDVGIPRDCHKSEVSQKERNIILLICGIQKNGTDEWIFRAERVTDIENKCMNTKGDGRWGDELGDWN